MPTRVAHWLPVLATLFLCATALAPAAAQSEPDACGELRNAYGPFDYRKDKDKLGIVESAHFTPQVENLVRGVSGPIGAELNYTLRAFPNHHRVLVALTRFGEKMKHPQPEGLQYPIECYFVRAMRFAPDDNTVRLLYAQYLAKHGRNVDAANQLEQTSKIAGDNGFTHYNIGLIYAEMKQYDQALAKAHKALELGFERPELKAALERAGKWQEPPRQ
jgi:uncharacterized protein (TIGR02996 family)